jgi:hypothetical protein
MTAIDGMPMTGIQKMHQNNTLKLLHGHSFA